MKNIQKVNYAGSGISTAFQTARTSGERTKRIEDVPVKLVADGSES